MRVMLRRLPSNPPATLPILVESSSLGMSGVSNTVPESFNYYSIILYKAALNGLWKTIEPIVTANPTWLHTSITKGGETVLHIAAAAKHVSLVEKLVDHMDTTFLFVPNKIGNTALCFAAVSGVVEIARAMLERKECHELAIVRGNHGMMPLHMAVLLGHRGMVRYLLSVTNCDNLTDQDYMDLVTSSIETDLFDVALEIVQKRPYLATLRDSKGETALHTVARKPLRPTNSQPSMWQRFKMQWREETDQGNGTEPQAALELAEILWKEVIKHGQEDISHLIGHPWRLIFVAAKLGKVGFLTVLIRSYPDIIWKVEENRYSIFHIAIIHRHEEVFKLIYELWAIKDLIATYKDDEGNNMLHLASKLAPSNRLKCISGAALQMQREILWFETVKKIVRPEYIESENKELKTPEVMFSEEHEGLRSKGEEWMKKTAESCALVAALIATVDFSAAIQLPGGVNDQGNPVLVKRPSFVIFAITNAVSLFSSTASILMFLSILTSRYAEQDFLVKLPVKLMWGLILLLISIATMIMSFTATIFLAFLDGSKRWVTIPIALIASIPVMIFVFNQFPLVIDIYQSMYKSKTIFQTCRTKLDFSAEHQGYDDTIRPLSYVTRSEPSANINVVANNSFVSVCKPTAADIIRPLASQLKNV